MAEDFFPAALFWRRALLEGALKLSADRGRVLASVQLDGVLDRGFEQLLFCVGGQGDGASTSCCLAARFSRSWEVECLSRCTGR